VWERLWLRPPSPSSGSTATDGLFQPDREPRPAHQHPGRTRPDPGRPAGVARPPSGGPVRLELAFAADVTPGLVVRTRGSRLRGGRRAWLRFGADR
jgi:hypothetical protein